jgi:hypothetical protein
MPIPSFTLRHIAAAARKLIQTTIAHGINVARPDYFSSFGMEAQPVITALNNTPNLNAQGWQIIPAGGGSA